MKYQVIYADPPWSYGDKVLNNGHGKRFDALNIHYQVMKINSICNLKVKDIADVDCALFMWSTDSHLPDAIELIKKWGFEYKTIAFYWLKVSSKTGKPVTNLGKWTQKNGELCLFATKGKCQKLLNSRKVHQLIVEPRTIHSRKPSIVRNKIVELFGNRPRIELFAREKVEGWDVWGNEVKSDILL